MDLRTLKALIRSELPESAFRPRPWRALLVPPLLAGIAVCTWFIVQQHPQWYISLLLSLAVGQMYAVLGFLAHEAMHGAIFRSMFGQYLLGYIGLGIFLISPHLWRVWHNQVHHGNTNQPNRDPDSFGNLDKYQQQPHTRFFLRLAPGSRHWLSYLFLSYWFTAHGQVILWFQSRYSQIFKSFNLNRRRAMIDVAALGLFWLCIATWAGLYGSLYAILIPMAIANAILMSYIATNHFMRPQSVQNDPIHDSMSISTSPLIDFLHLNFSHHVEHHLFPAMSPAFAPLVRQSLRRHVPGEYVSPPHWKALLYLYRTPRLYLDAKTLVDPGSSHTVWLPELERKLLNRADPFEYM